jgi:DNA helicase-2/ATP-dependent DNA helicase PcrA
LVDGFILPCRPCVLHKFEKEIEDIFNSGDFESFKSYKYNKSYTITRNITDIIEDLEEELDMEKEFIKENPDSIKTLMFRENIKALKKLTHSLKQLRVKIKETTMNELAKKYKINPHAKMGYLETLIYLFIYSEVVGIEKMIRFEYCVVDEGQDFSVLEYLVLSKLVLNGRFCILGDLNQSYEVDGITTWSDIAEVIREAKKANTFELNTNYRSTKPIIDLANQILKPYTDIIFQQIH